MAEHARFTEATGFRVYFCDPHSPWQRGTNENANGPLRQFFPKGTEFADVTDEEVREAQDLLNGKPRETLGWRTPAEALAEGLAKAGAMAAGIRRASDCHNPHFDNAKRPAAERRIAMTPKTATP